MLFPNLLMVLSIYFLHQHTTAVANPSGNNDVIMAAMNALDIKLSHLIDRINDVDQDVEQLKLDLQVDVKNRFQKVDRTLADIKGDLKLIHGNQITADSLKGIITETINNTKVFHQTALCDPGCVHGSCTVANTCICDQGWTGEQCDNAVCEG